jgi:AcrR family transcriptional regulator
MSSPVSSIYGMGLRGDVIPNRRGARSREAVLDAAERVMAERGYEAATVASLVEEAGVPASSIYHYFGSKEGVLLAVMERGAERFHKALPAPTGRQGSQVQHLRRLMGLIVEGLERRPDFLSLILVMATQPRVNGNGEVDVVVERVRELALARLRNQMAIVFEIDAESPQSDHLARFALAAIEGAFLATQADPRLSLAELLEHLPTALIAIRREVGRAGRATVPPRPRSRRAPPETRGLS